MTGVASGSPGHPTSHAECQVVNIINMMYIIDNLTPVFLDSSDLGASCLHPAQHLSLSVWQYLSTVPALQPNQQDSQTASSGQHGTVLKLTDTLLELARRARGLSAACSTAVTAALESQRLPSTSPATAAFLSRLVPVGGGASSTPQAKAAEAAVLTRHDMECLCLQTTSLQLSLLIKRTQQQQPSSPTAGPSAEQLLTDLVPQVPKPLQRMLRQLGCSPHAALWQALWMTQDYQGWSCSHIEDELIQRAGCCVTLRNHFNRFLLDSTPTDLARSLLLELQQHLQLYMLLPGVLLQWAADTLSTSSNYSKCCYRAAQAAQISANMHLRVLQGGPAILYQHMTGHSRPQPSTQRDLPADSQQTLAVLVPVDILQSQLQLLEQLLNSLLQLRRSECSRSLQCNCAPSSSSRSSRSSASAQHAGVVDSDLSQAIANAGCLALFTASSAPAPGLTWGTTHTAETRASFSSAAGSDAGRLCALLEDASCSELAAGQQAAALAAAQGIPASNNCQWWAPGTTVHETVRVCLSNINSMCDGCDIDGFQFGPLVDPIVALHGPGSRPCKQLCSLLTTLLKCSAWECCPEALASNVSDVSTRAHEAEASRGAVSGALCAMIEAATDLVTACPDPSTSSGAVDSNSICSSSAAHKEARAEAVLPWLALLGRCCLQWGHLLRAAVSLQEAAGDMSAAANKQLRELIFVAFRGLAEAETGKPHIGHGASVLLNFGVAVGVSKAWLSAGSNTTQLAALGYDAEGFMQCLHSAEATISAVGTALHDGTAQPKDLLPPLQK